MVYLDYNAHAPLLDEAKAAMFEAIDVHGNASSIHACGRQARKIMEDARQGIAGLVGARSRELIFTAGATEGNVQVIRTLLNHVDVLYISAIEHPSVREAACEFGNIRIIPATREGVIDLEKLEEALETETVPMVGMSVMAANNETGVIQPVPEIARLARNRGVLFHTDATQAIGRMPMGFHEWGVDYMTFSSHKLGGPLGAGVVVVRDGCPLDALLIGGGQERNLRSGTPNVPAIAGCAAALEAMSQYDWSPENRLRDWLEEEILAILPEENIPGFSARRLPNTSCLRMPGVDSQTQVIAMDLEGFAVSSGSACSSGKVRESEVLRAMGLGEDAARESIRVSLPPRASTDDIERFVRVWREIFNNSVQSGLSDRETRRKINGINQQSGN